MREADQLLGVLAQITASFGRQTMERRGAGIDSFMRHGLTRIWNHSEYQGRRPTVEYAVRGDPMTDVVTGSVCGLRKEGFFPSMHGLWNAYSFKLFRHHL